MIATLSSSLMRASRERDGGLYRPLPRESKPRRSAPQPTEARDRPRHDRFVALRLDGGAEELPRGGDTCRRARASRLLARGPRPRLSSPPCRPGGRSATPRRRTHRPTLAPRRGRAAGGLAGRLRRPRRPGDGGRADEDAPPDRERTRLKPRHQPISYAVLFL